tara:strand:- start:190 stop:894 length:705 start_codon:yes stop_codon:yes gene_type:complete
MYKGKKILAIIPARGGSKGIVNKNLANLDGKKLLDYTAESLNKVKKIIDLSIISSDDFRIINHARKLGISAPFIRPKYLSGDKVDVTKVLIHSVKYLEEKKDFFFDIILCLEPTCPLRSHKDITAAIKKIINEKKSSVWSITETDSKYHPQKQLLVSKRNLKFYLPIGKKIFARQQLSKIYHRNGAVYAISRDYLINQKKLIGKNTGYIISKNYMTSIDNHFDIKYLEWIKNNF